MENNVEKLFEENIRLVDYAIGMYTNAKYTKNNPLYDDEDLRQIGAMALFKAAKNFDESKGFRFSTYAVNAIRKDIYKTFEKQSHHEDTSFQGGEYSDLLCQKEENEDRIGFFLTVESLCAVFNGNERGLVYDLLMNIAAGHSIKDAASLSGIPQRNAYIYLDRIRRCDQLAS